jgi:hypothetical protein
MKVFAVVNDESNVLRMFSTLADAEAFVAEVKAMDALHAEWIFSPRSQREDFVAPDGLEDFIGVDIWGVEEFELY